MAPLRSTALALAESESTTEEAPRSACPPALPRGPDQPAPAFGDADLSIERPAPLVLVQARSEPAGPPEDTPNAPDDRPRPEVVPCAERPQNEDVHAWLCQLANMIESERESRWQRILSLIPGTVLGRTTVSG